MILSQVYIHLQSSGKKLMDNLNYTPVSSEECDDGQFLSQSYDGHA